MVMCCIRLGDVAAGREAVQIIVRLGEIPGISALTQAMISGAKNHQNNLADIERTEREALEAMKTKEFPKVGESVVYYSPYSSLPSSSGSPPSVPHFSPIATFFRNQQPPDF